MDDRRSQRERMLAGDLHIADAPELAAMSRRAAELQDRFNRCATTDDAQRRAILKDLLGAVGADTEARPPSSATTACTSASARASS
jgi:maltose O-acetyltransferase